MFPCARSIWVRCAWDEVPQVYLDAPATKPAGVEFTPRTLVAFDRVSLEAGEKREVTLHVVPRAFSSGPLTRSNG